jgi:membrane protease YdiL (CAAX protease family)
MATKIIKVMEIMFAVSWIIGLILCSIITFIVWKPKDKKKWNYLGYMWLIMVVFGWVLGFTVLIAAIYVSLVPKEN